MTWILLSALPVFVLAVSIFNASTWRRGRARSNVRAAVSVLIPARNEEKSIRTAILSVLFADTAGFVKEILVYDDKSTDSTRRIVQEMATQDERIRLISGGPLPSGWVGKPHAASQLGDAARGEILLFMDADVELKAGGLERLLSLTERPACGRVITAMPEQLSVTFVERLILPLLPLTYLAWLPLRLVEVGTDARTVAANGQLLLIRKADYLKLGGFESVRNEIVDDVAFCRHAKRSHMRVVFADGSLMARCRMYEGARETISGFSKNLYEGVGGKLGVISVMLLYVAAFLMPYVALATWAVLPGESGDLLGASLLGIGANLMLQLILVWRYKQPPEYILLAPLSIIGFCLIAINSWRWQRAGRVNWAGRSYEGRAIRLEAHSDSVRSGSRNLEGSAT